MGINDGTVQAEIIESKWKNKAELKRYVEDYILGAQHTSQRIENRENILPPIFEYIKVRPQAILTDFLSFSESYAAGRYLISEKVKNVFSKFNVRCRIYDQVGLYQKDNKIDGYSNLHLLPLKVEKVVDFRHSVLFNGLKLADKTYRHADSYEEFIALTREGKLLNFEKVSIYKDAITDLDVLTFDWISKIYISEQLKVALEVAGVTGIEYLEPKDPALYFTD